MTEQAISFMRRLREGLEAGLDLPDALARGAAALPRDARATVERLVDRVDGDYEDDEWGFDEEFADLIEPFFGFLYDTWWRVRAEGLDNVPSHGRALLAANHAGILPWDATMVSMAVLREHPLPRHPRFLVLNWAFDLPWVSTAMRRVGGVVASPYNAMRLLEQDHLVAVFPEGVKGTGKPYSERYRLQRFGRGGFVEIALRTGAPIVPVAIVGSEEIYPKIGDLPGARPTPRRAVLSGHAHLPLAGAARRRPVALAVANRVSRTDPDRLLWPRRRRRPPARARALRTRSCGDSGRGLRESRAPRSPFRLGSAAGARPAIEKAQFRAYRDLASSVLASPPQPPSPSWPWPAQLKLRPVTPGWPMSPTRWSTARAGRPPSS